MVGSMNPFKKWINLCLIRIICISFFLVCMSWSSGCTLMLAGSIVHKVVTELQSRKKVPGSNQVIYNVLASDTATNVHYIVDIHVSVHISNEKNAMLFCVEKVVVSYQDELHGRVKVRDLDGDGVIDAVGIEDRNCYAQASRTSLDYLRKQAGDAAAGDPALEIGGNPEHPWYAFVEKDRMVEEPSGPAVRLNAYPFQERYARIALAALKELDFHSAGRRP